MSQHNCMQRFYCLFDTTQSMNDTYNMIWPFCKILPGRTRGEHALHICKTFVKLFPHHHHHRFFISFQGDIDEYLPHSLTLEQIEEKYRIRSRPRYRSNIVQRIQQILQIMRNEAQDYPNSSLYLLIFSDGYDNQSAQELKKLHGLTINELRSFGTSATIIKFSAIDQCTDDRFPSENTNPQVTSALQQNIVPNIHDDILIDPTEDDDYPLSIEETQPEQNFMYTRIC